MPEYIVYVKRFDPDPDPDLDLDLDLLFLEGGLEYSLQAVGL